MWVKNVKGSSRFDKYNWLRYWEEQTGMTTIRCLAMDCNKQTTELVGAHVQKIYDTDKNDWMIVDLEDSEVIDTFNKLEEMGIDIYIEEDEE